MTIIEHSKQWDKILMLLIRISLVSSSATIMIVVPTVRLYLLHWHFSASWRSQRCWITICTILVSNTIISHLIVSTCEGVSPRWLRSLMHYYGLTQELGLRKIYSQCAVRLFSNPPSPVNMAEIPYRVTLCVLIKAISRYGECVGSAYDGVESFDLNVRDDDGKPNFHSTVLLYFEEIISHIPAHKIVICRMTLHKVKTWQALSMKEGSKALATWLVFLNPSQVGTLIL